MSLGVTDPTNFSKNPPGGFRFGREDLNSPGGFRFGMEDLNSPGGFRFGREN